MWGRQLLLGGIGLSAGMSAALGLFAFIVGLGVVSDFADRTHTGKYVLLYETCISLGGIIGNIVFVYHVKIGIGQILVPVFGMFSGIFVGCWSMALAEVLNVFPIFVRRVKLLKAIPFIILSIAIGKGVGALLFFAKGW